MDIQSIINKQSNSPFLKGVDIEDKEVPVTISNVEEVEQDRDGRKVPQLVLSFEGKEKKLGLNSTNTQKMAKLFGYEGQDWIGKNIILHTVDTNNPTTGQLVPGIRIKAAPDHNQEENVDMDQINL